MFKVEVKVSPTSRIDAEVFLKMVRRLKASLEAHCIKMKKDPKVEIGRSFPSPGDHMPYEVSIYITTIDRNWASLPTESGQLIKALSEEFPSLDGKLDMWVVCDSYNYTA